MAIARATVILWTLPLVFLLLPTGAQARREYVEQIPNGNNVGTAHALGHVTWDGDGPLNDFGKAFAAAGSKWTKALCQGDADGDGQTNGEELGDPCCVWRSDDGALPLVTDVLSHPGDHGDKLNATDLRDRLRVCQALEVSTTPPPDMANSSRSDASSNSSSRSDNNTDGSDRQSIQPPLSVVPAPASLSPMSISHRSLRWGIVVVGIVIFVVA